MASKSNGHKQEDLLLGKYKLGRLLGRGTFAKVYSARSLSDNSSVAVKVLDKHSLAHTAGIVPMILREVSAMRRLSPHPNIINLYEVLATKSKIFLVMEHARGGALFARIARCGRLPEPAALRYFQQLISALGFCHARGITHRDVKPENLLLDCDSNLKLSDFGLSAFPEQLRDGLLHTTCGTPAYAAPEVIRRKGYDGAKADAWSCGVILYVLLAGFLPFNDANLALMYRKIQKREFRFPPWFSSSAKQVISRLLDPNPETRISIDGLTEFRWIKGCCSLQPEMNLITTNSSSASSASSLPLPMNAFDIISLSPGLDLSGLFDEQGGRRERRFTSTVSAERILERIGAVGAKLGYAVERRKGGVVGRGRWGSILSADVSEVVPSIVLVEVRVDDSGDGPHGGDEVSLWWGHLRDELGDTVFD